MARIKTIDFINYAINRRDQTKLEYEPDKNFFFIRCPIITEHMWSKEAKITGLIDTWIRGNHVWIIRGNTANECIDNFEAFLEISKNQKIEPRKVIILKLKCISPNVALAKDRVYQKDNEIEISFKYAICYETQSAWGNKDYFEEIENGIPKGRFVYYDHYTLPYSKESEAFCKWFLERTQELIKLIYDKLGTEQKLIDTIRSGIKFLPGEESSE